MLLAGCLGVAAPLAITQPVMAQQPKQTVDTLIKRGQEHFDDQEYVESIQTLSAALMRPGIAKAEKIEVYRLLAYNYIVLQRAEEADGAVRGLLVLDEQFELPDGESPRFRDFFRDTRKKWEADGKPGKEVDKPAGPSVSITHVSPAQAEEDTAIPVEGTVEDPEGLVEGVKLFYRAGTVDKFAAAPVQFTVLRFTGEIPAEAVVPPLVEYYLEAVDTHGITVGLRGDSAAPLRVAVAEGSSVVSSPWLWVPVSLAVVGGIVATAVVLGTQSSTSAVTVNVFD